MATNDLQNAVELHRRGDHRGAASLYRKLLALDSQNIEVRRLLGVASLQAGDLVAAEDALCRAAALAPGSTQIMCDLGTVRLAQRRFREARDLLEAVLQTEPNHPDALNNCAIAWTEMGQIERALPMLERFAQMRPQSAAAHRQLGDACYKLGQTDDAISAFRRAIELDPSDRQSRLALGDALESLGQWRGARAQYLAILRRAPDSPLALARLIMLRGEEPEAAWLDAAERIVASDQVRPEPRARVAIALAHFYDRRKNYAAAYPHLATGNGLLRALRPYDASRFGEAVDRLIEAFSADQLAEFANRPGSRSARPIFVLGMPRSGTTLVEQILASHSQVAPGGELSTMLNVAARVQSVAKTAREYPQAVLDLDDGGMEQLAQYYLGRLERVSSDARHVTDKLPFNFMHVGLIAMLFPCATIIHCRRDPLDTCLSCYFTSFSEHIRFANDLATAGTYYRHYQRLMDHWDRALPGRIKTIDYEILVLDADRAIRELVEHCGLDWEDGCLEFHATERGVRTPSRWQVRQRISSSSIGRWRHYEPWLEPLTQALKGLSSGAMIVSPTTRISHLNTSGEK